MRNQRGRADANRRRDLDRIRQSQPIRRTDTRCLDRRLCIERRHLPAESAALLPHKPAPEPRNATTDGRGLASGYTAAPIEAWRDLRHQNGVRHFSAAKRE